MIANFTEGELASSLKIIARMLCSEKGLRVDEKPRAFLLGGQSGAGKTTLHKILAKEFCGNVIVINGDEYRAHHPRFEQLSEQYGDEAVSYTASWAGRMTEALIDALSAAGYNLVVEGTLRTSEVPLKTAALLRSRGYSVALALMAVKPELSLVSCKIRYEEMRLAGKTPRATDPVYRNKIVQEIVGNLSVLEESGLFDEVRLYSRSRGLLYPADGTATAAETLQGVLFGDWSEEERGHYEFLRKKLLRLTS